MNKDHKKEKLVRFDNNIIHHGVDLISLYQDDSSYVLDILLFNAYKYQENLFGFEELNPDEFAEIMKYHKNNLLMKHKNPACLKSNDPVIRKNFTNVIENALYRMDSETLTFSKKAYDKRRDSDVIEVKAYQLVKNLKKHKFRRKDKFIYTYNFNEMFREHMNYFFTPVCLESLKRLRQLKATFLYLTLVNLQDIYFNNPNEKIVLNMDYLCNQSQINIKKDTDKKQKLKYKLRQVQERTELDFDFKEVNINGHYNYGFEINYLSKYNVEKDQTILKEAFHTALVQNLKHLFYELHKIYANDNQEKFRLWLKDGKYDAENKFFCYITTYSDIKKIPTKDALRYCRDDANKYFNIFITTSKINKYKTV